MTVKTCLKTQKSKTKIMVTGPITSREPDGRKVDSDKFYFHGYQNHCRQ